MTEPQNTARSHAIRRLAVILAGGVLGVAVGLAGVYGIGRLAGNVAVDAACKPALETARRLAPLAKGEVAAVAIATAPKALPALAFQDGNGAPKTARRLARPDGAVQPVGHLVLALPQGNAGARRAARQSGRAEV